MALVLNIADDWQHKELIVSSTIMLIISSTLVFGSTTALAGKFLLGEKKHDPLVTQENDSKIVLEYVKNDQPNE